MSFPLPLSHSASAPLAFFEFFESSSVLPLGLQHALFLCLEYPSFILSEVQRSFLLPLYQSILLRAWPLSCSPARFFHSMFPLLYFLTHLLICFCIMWLIPSPFILCFVSGEIIFFFLSITVSLNLHQKLDKYSFNEWMNELINHKWELFPFSWDV